MSGAEKTSNAPIVIVLIVAVLFLIIFLASIKDDIQNTEVSTTKTATKSQDKDNTQADDEAIDAAKTVKSKILEATEAAEHCVERSEELWENSLFLKEVEDWSSEERAQVMQDASETIKICTEDRETIIETKDYLRYNKYQLIGYGIPADEFISDLDSILYHVTSARSGAEPIINWGETTETNDLLQRFITLKVEKVFG